jgi:hypothetical protein
MSSFNNQFKVKNKTFKHGLMCILFTGFLMFSPAINKSQTVLAAIDETMPDSIPSQITDDWEDQDGITGSEYASATSAILDKLSAEYVTLYNTAKASFTGDRNLYYLACHFRRIAKMKSYTDCLSNILFARHHNFGGIMVGYHDNVSASTTDDGWTAKSALCILKMTNYYSTPTDLLAKTDAVVRDPCISFDGKKVLFAMSGSAKGTGYKIYEMDIADPASIKQLTKDDVTGAVVADFEPCYLPNGDIAFTSTRCFGLNPLGMNATTNMFIMDGTGKYMRRVGFDQVNTFYPAIRDDGTILYTRWEFNDRSMLNNMGLFRMNPDGCHQTEVFGNQTSWPYTKIHARPIPGSEKIICVAGGNHGPYSGELMIIDPVKGSNGLESEQMIAPKRETKPVKKKTDKAMGDVEFLFQNPLPLDENNFIVSWRKSESEKLYKLYFMDVDGKRELLAWADQSVSQPVFIKARQSPPRLATQADYSKTTAEFTIQDVYKGAGLKKADGTIVARGTAKKLRVVQLNYRIQDGSIGVSMGSGSGVPEPNFVPAIMCPISLYGGSWESKTVLGETPIFSDGSAAFIVPARTPVYFQVLDSNGYCIATMRSWSTLMPGEQFHCLGCHESKSESPNSAVKPLAGEATPLETPLGVENQYFDYGKMIQPIWDKNCISCHKENHESGFDLRGDLLGPADFSSTRKSWTRSYVSLFKGICFATSNKAINICTIFSTPEQKAAYSFGSSQSPVMTKVINGTHHDVKLTQIEKRIVACWIDLCAPHAGYYTSYMSAADSSKYMKLVDRRLKWESIEAKNVYDYVYKMPTEMDPHKSAQSSTVYSTKKMGMKYQVNQRTLVLDKVVNGELTLLDLKGREIVNFKLAKLRDENVLSIQLPATLSRGLYIARF